jgi:hypothetical protein
MKVCAEKEGFASEIKRSRRRDYGSALPSIVLRELFLSRQTISQHTVHNDTNPHLPFLSKYTKSPSE